MSVLVKGIEMPQSCSECGIKARCFANAKNIEWLTYHPAFYEERLTDCPLVEVPTPHGRLIDADALEVRKHEKEAYDTVVALYKQKKFNANYEYYRGYSDGLVTASGLVRFAPTIIEAEGEET